MDTGVNTFTPTAFTPATTTLVATVVTIDIAYYTTAYTLVLPYSCTPIMYI